MTVRGMSAKAVPFTTQKASNGQAPEAPFQAAYSRERILNYGKEGTSKTQSWLSIAELYPKVPFFCIDTDDSVQRMLDTDFSELKNLTVGVAQDWVGFTTNLALFIKSINAYVRANPPKRTEDYPWLVIDFADSTWDMVQGYFTDEVFSTDLAEYFLMARKKMKGKDLTPLEGWTDWQVINKIFQSVWNPLTKGGGPFHLYLTAKAKPASGIEGRTLYKKLKMMPEGEKRMAHRVHTVIMSSVDSSGWYISSAKDRGRELMDDKQNSNFAVSYLLKVAKWQT